MKIQLIKDFEQFGVNSVIDVDQPTGNRLVSDGIGVQVPDDTRSRKYKPGQQLESLCVPLSHQQTIIWSLGSLVTARFAGLPDLPIVVSSPSSSLELYTWCCPHTCHRSMTLVAVRTNFKMYIEFFFE